MGRQTNSSEDAELDELDAAIDAAFGRGELDRVRYAGYKRRVFNWRRPADTVMLTGFDEPDDD
jgi:hypothetical protein